MRSHLKRIAPALAAAALAATVPTQIQAQAPAICLSEAELADVIVYATPAIVTGVRGKCSKTLPPTGFIASKATSWSSKYAALQGSTWPSAKSALVKLLGAKAGANAQGQQMLAMVSALPDESVRPLVDSMVAQKIGESVKVGDCAKAERAMQLASVMAPRDNAALMAFVLANSGSKDLPVCRPKT